MPSIALFVTWKQLGFFILLYLAALQNVPKELYESAAVDGAVTVAVVPVGHRARRPPGHHAGRAAGHHHRREPVHRAVPAHRRRRPERHVHLAGAADVPAGIEQGHPGRRRPRSACCWCIGVLLIAWSSNASYGGSDDDRSLTVPTRSTPAPRPSTTAPAAARRRRPVAAARRAAARRARVPVPVLLHDRRLAADAAGHLASAARCRIPAT